VIAANPAPAQVEAAKAALQYHGQTQDRGVPGRQADAEFKQEGMYLIIGLGPVAHQ
jgi:hypothetical protein